MNTTFNSFNELAQKHFMHDQVAEYVPSVDEYRLLENEQMVQEVIHQFFKGAPDSFLCRETNELLLGSRLLMEMFNITARWYGYTFQAGVYTKLYWYHQNGNWLPWKGYVSTAEFARTQINVSSRE